MRRPQFSLRTLLLSATCAGAAVGLLMLALRNASTGAAAGPSDLFAFLAIGPLLGATITAPFRRTRLGIDIGFFAQIILWFGCAGYFMGWHRMWD